MCLRKKHKYLQRNRSKRNQKTCAKTTNNNKISINVKKQLKQENLDMKPLIKG